MSLTTIGEIVDRAKTHWLEGTYSAQLNTLSADVNSSVTEFPMTLPQGTITPGSFLSVESELCYVVDRDTTNNRTTVIRGMRGTTAAAHTSGTAVEVNPRFPNFLLLQAIDDEINSWPDSLYVVESFAATLAANAGQITIPTTINGFTPRNVLQVRRASLDTTDTRYRRVGRFEPQWNILSTNVISLDLSLDVTTTWAVKVACAFNTSTIATATTTATVGLTGGMPEIAAVGAAYRALQARGAVRLFPEAETQSRSAGEVGAHDIPVFANSLLGWRNKRIADEAMRLVKSSGFGGF